MILNYWPTPIMFDSIEDNKLLDKTTEYILSSYNDKTNANVLHENILDDIVDALNFREKDGTSYYGEEKE